MREAREKLTASASSHYGFDLELLRLFAKGRRSSGPAMAGLGALAAAVATTWVAVDTVLLWLTLDLGALLLASHFAGKVLGAEDSTLNARRWQRKFIFTEALQGVAWAVMVWFIGLRGLRRAASFLFCFYSSRQ
jgi:two-component system cell cycle sensor histidine kinase PleC